MEKILTLFPNAAKLIAEIFSICAAGLYIGRIIYGAFKTRRKSHRRKPKASGK